MTNTGLFITVEGVDGAGKSTPLSWLNQSLQAIGRTVVLTREPGGTALGEHLRELLLHEKMDLETETLLMFASRREHIAQVILPALARGDIIISDRFTDATYAYQGGGRGVSLSKIEQLETWVQHDLQPHLTLLFDVPLEVAQARLAKGRSQLDKFEQESMDFFQRTRQAYLARATAHPERIAIIDSTVDIEQTQIQIAAALQTHLNIAI
ncbi:dTMP kinase [Hydromonas duriensis]|nr:dTMP kinase [Hydromonas duriensis]